jgi:hypothetical protein
MGRLLCAALLGGSFFLGTASSAGPVGGAEELVIRLPAGSQDKPSEHELAKVFTAGQRACVIVVGRVTEAPLPEEFRLLIFDDKDQLVASDQGAAELVAVWYPRRQASYRIRILNPDDHEQEVLVSVR